MSYTIEQLDCAVRTAVAAERERCVKVCEMIEDDAWRAYKGLSPYEPLHPLWADAHTQGVSDGAARCADAIRRVQTVNGDSNG